MLRLLAVTDGREGGGHHHAFHTGFAKAQHTKRPLAGNDQLVLVLRDRWRKGRGHVQRVFAARDGVRPAGVFFQVGDGKRQAFARLGAPLPLREALRPPRARLANGRPHVVAGGQQLQDAMAPHKSRAARYKNFRHRRFLCVPLASQETSGVTIIENGRGKKGTPGECRIRIVDRVIAGGLRFCFGAGLRIDLPSAPGRPDVQVLAMGISAAGRVSIEKL